MNKKTAPVIQASIFDSIGNRVDIIFPPKYDVNDKTNIADNENK